MKKFLATKIMISEVYGKNCEQKQRWKVSNQRKAVLMFFSFCGTWHGRGKMIALQNVYTRRYFCFCRDCSVRQRSLKKGHRPRTTVYTNFWLVEQYKHDCCDWSLALHFKIVSEMISLKYALVCRLSIHRLFEWAQFLWINDRKKINVQPQRTWILMFALTSINGRNMPHFSSGLCGKCSSSVASLCRTPRRWEM